ncbi:hypothetical protein ACHQM5_017271 [Ranunculus cassubicifolius]
MENGVKGTATSLASLFPVEEAQKAIKRVEDAIIEKKEELEKLNHFISDNNNLIKLVQRLPDELSHDVMVPFGKAAFFPGRLIHTNEFLVLLGEGYHVERTSKQTVDILQRRGKVLDSHVDSINAIVSDLKAEASFFGATATEAAEGFIDIVEAEELTPEEMTNVAGSARPESDFPSSSNETQTKASDDDKEYARIMARLEELEREELAAESANDGDEDESTEADMGCSISPDFFDKTLKISEAQQPKLHTATAKRVPSGEQVQKDYHNESTLIGSKDQHLQEKQHVGKSDTLEKLTEKAVTGTTTEPPTKTRTNSNVQQQAFTGSIVEHSHGLQPKQASKSSSTGAAPSKPVSRFKMQKGGGTR